MRCHEHPGREEWGRREGGERQRSGGGGEHPSIFPFKPLAGRDSCALQRGGRGRGGGGGGGGHLHLPAAPADSVEEHSLPLQVLPGSPPPQKSGRHPNYTENLQGWLFQETSKTSRRGPEAGALSLQSSLKPPSQPARLGPASLLPAAAAAAAADCSQQPRPGYGEERQRGRRRKRI